MRPFARYIGCLFLVLTTAVGCAAPILANTDIKCPLGQTAVGDNCKNYSNVSQMDGFAQQIIDSLRDFARSENIPEPTRDMLRFITAANASSSPCAASPDEPYASCYSDGIFYLGSMMLYTNYTASGVLAPIAITAHEYGHYLQAEAGLDGNFMPGTRAMVRHENQADCVSGAYIAWLGKQQRIKLSDLVFLLDMIWNHGSNPYVEPNKVHGETQERTMVFTTGYDDGLAACNSIGNGSIT